MKRLIAILAACLLAAALFGAVAMCAGAAPQQDTYGASAQVEAAPAVQARAQLQPFGARLRTWHEFRAIRCSDGPAGARTPESDAHCREVWRERVHNTTVDEGLNDLLSKYFKGSTYTAAWYVGIKNAGSIVAGDTAASHAGWTENVTYTEAARPTLTLGSVSGKSVSNTASKASFSINGGATIAGAFVISDSTKSGTSGVLYGASDFGGGTRALLSGDTLTITVTLTTS